MPKDFARTDRIAEQIQREMAELVRLKINDPRVRMVTMTGVEVARDYSHAKVFFTRWMASTTKLQKGLERASGFLRSQLAHSLKLRVMPQLHFVLRRIGRARQHICRSSSTRRSPATSMERVVRSPDTAKRNPGITSTISASPHSPHSIAAGAPTNLRAAAPDGRIGGRMNTANLQRAAPIRAWPGCNGCNPGRRR